MHQRLHGDRDLLDMPPGSLYIARLQASAYRLGLSQKYRTLRVAERFAVQYPLNEQCEAVEVRREGVHGFPHSNQGMKRLYFGVPSC
jgi:hypothetical protein